LAGACLARQLAAGTRSICKTDMMHSDVMLAIEIDPDTCDVRPDGGLLICEPAAQLS
jgi:urease subunit alpha